MVNYKSETVELNYSAETVFGKLSNISALGDLIANAPADALDASQAEALSKINVTADTISFPAGPVGELTLKVAEMIEPTLIRLEGENSPVPLSLSLDITPRTADCCEAQVEIALEIPMIMKPMINGPMKKMTEQFGQMLKRIPFDR